MALRGIVSRHGGMAWGWTGDLRELFQPEWFYDSMQEQSSIVGAA